MIGYSAFALEPAGVTIRGKRLCWRRHPLLRATILIRKLPAVLTALTAAILAGRVAIAAPVRIVGGPSVGCIAGAVELPPQGPGYQTIHVAISHFWGAPSTVSG